MSTDTVESGKNFHLQGDLDQAERIYRSILEYEPVNVEALHYLGLVMHQRGDNEMACELISGACEAGLDNAKVHNNLGSVLIELERYDEALSHLDRSLTIDPEHSNAFFNRGRALVEMEQWQLAEASLRRAVELDPSKFEAWFLLARSLRQQFRLSEATEVYERAIVLKPDSLAAISNLGNIHQMQGNIDRAIDIYRDVLTQDPANIDIRSKLLLALNYPDRVSQEEIDFESTSWNKFVPANDVDRSAHFRRREERQVLRIGFVSPDFRKHSVAYFFEPLLKELRHKELTIYCYAEVRKPDHVTERLRALSDNWRSTVGMNDRALASLIESDEIDILVDLAGHTQDNRLAVFAMRPAPVQATWLGYPNTTGLDAIDYRFVDTITDPEDSGAEKLVRMPNCFLCYQAPAEAPAVKVEVPGREIVFGSFNNSQKISDSCVVLWSEILQKIKGSCLVLKSTYLIDEVARQRLAARFIDQGIDSGRIRFLGRTRSTEEHLELYGDIDICLDTFPYNGTTTTCESLWMGVPVVTLLGKSHRARVSASILKQIDLEELIASNTTDYVEIAVGLANNSKRRRELRGGLREMMTELCDASRFATDMDGVFRDIWAKWCRE